MTQSKETEMHWEMHTHSHTQAQNRNQELLASGFMDSASNCQKTSVKD